MDGDALSIRLPRDTYGPMDIPMSVQELIGLPPD